MENTREPIQDEPEYVELDDADHPHRQLAIHLIEEAIEIWLNEDIEGERYYALEDLLTKIIHHHLCTVAKNAAKK